jgi:hypothetical protein
VHQPCSVVYAAVQPVCAASSIAHLVSVWLSVPTEKRFLRWHGLRDAARRLGRHRRVRVRLRCGGRADKPGAAQ